MSDETRFWVAIWTAIMIALGGACAILLMTGCQPAKPKKDYQETSVESINKAWVDSLRGRVDLAEKRIKDKMDSVSIIVQNQQAILKSFKPVYEKINTTADNNQLAITNELLTKHRTTPVTRY